MNACSYNYLYLYVWISSCWFTHTPQSQWYLVEVVYPFLEIFNLYASACITYGEVHCSTSICLFFKWYGISSFFSLFNYYCYWRTGDNTKLSTFNIYVLYNRHRTRRKSCMTNLIKRRFCIFCRFPRSIFVFIIIT